MFFQSFSTKLIQCNQEIQARVGLRRNASSEQQSRSPPSTTPVHSLYNNGTSASRVSSLPQQSEAYATVSDYLVGPQLDDALAAGQDVSISWPFADGDVRDWIQAEAIWYVTFLLCTTYYFTISTKEAHIIHAVTTSTHPK